MLAPLVYSLVASFSYWSAWFDGLTITNKTNGHAVLAGLLVDQAALYGVLVKIRGLGLQFIAVQPLEERDIQPLQDRCVD